MVTKEQLLKLKKEMLLEEEKKKKSLKTTKRKTNKRNRVKKDLSESGDVDYGFCPVYGGEPTIEAHFENGKLIREYSNGKRVR